MRFVVRYRLEVVSFFVGAIILAFELTASRIVEPYIGNTIYIWTSIIGSVLGALAIGYAIGGYLADKRHNPQDVMLLLLGGAALLLAVDFIKDPLLGVITEYFWHWPLQLQAFIPSIILFTPSTLVLGAISPYLVRLNLTDLKTSGRHAARISAAGTVGSLVGTFITGYFLFGFVGTRAILAVLAVCAMMVSLLLNTKDLLLARLVLTVVALLLVLYPPSLNFVPTGSHDIDTRYNRYVISDYSYNGRPIRVLRVDPFDWQSGIYLSGDHSLVFPYTQAFAAITQAYPEDHSILVIGGGAYTFPAYVAQLNRANHVDVVELDDQLATIASQHFNFVQPSNMRLITADGRQFINHNTYRYNLIFLDAFSGQVPAFQLLTKQAAERVSASLANNGVVAMNLVSPVQGKGEAYVDSVVKTYDQSFAHVVVLRENPLSNPSQRQNVLLLASQQPIDPSTLAQRTADPTFRQMAGTAVNPNVNQGQILTDDYAPVERLLALYR